MSSSACIDRSPIRDSLTGLLNCRGLKPWLERSVVEAREGEGIWTLCYLNLDHYWALRDRVGQAGGEVLLCQVADLLRGQTRTRDILARLGEDEFAVLLPYTNLSRGRRLARELRSGIERLDFCWRGHIYPVTASVGVSPVTSSVADPGTLLLQGDAACFTARCRGGNRVHVRSTSARGRSDLHVA